MSGSGKIIWNETMKPNTTAIATILLLALGLLNIPIASNISNAIVYLFLLGFFAREKLGLKDKDRALFESCLLSIGITTSLALLMGIVLPPAAIASKAAMALVVLSFMLISKDAKIQDVFANRDLRNKNIIMFLGALLPLAFIFALNPTIMFLSDGWWHCSIFNTVGLKSLPPSNPWMAGVSLGYPYSYHLYLNYAFGQGSCVTAMDSFTILMAFLTMAGIFWLTKEIYPQSSNKLALIAALMFIFVSTIGGIAFLYDVATKLPAGGVSAYLAFLKGVHGPHAWYSFAKFTGLPGIGMPFAQNAMVGSFHLPLLFGILYFSVRKRFFEAVLLLAPLVSSQPMLGILTSITFGIYVLLTRYLNPIRLAMLAIGAMLVDITYISALFSKVGSVGSSVLGITSKAALGALNFFIAYLPLVVIAVLFRGKKMTEDGKQMLIAFCAACVLITVFLNLGHLYVTLPAYAVIVILAAPYFEDLSASMKKENLLKIALILLLFISTAIMIGTYAFFKVPLSQPDIDASLWAKANTKPDAVFLSSMDLKNGSFDQAALDSFWVKNEEARLVASSGRQVNVYIAVYGGRLSYIGDLQTLFLYGENVIPRLDVYKSVFLERNEKSICSLSKNGISYVYSGNETFYFESGPCLSQVYDNGKVRIYRTAGN